MNLSTNPEPRIVKAALVDKRVRDKALAEQAQLAALQRQKEQDLIKAVEIKEQQLKREAELAKQKVQEETARQEKLVADEKARKVALEKQQKQAKEQEVQKQAKVLQEKKDKEIKAQAKALQEKQVQAQAQAKALQDKRDKEAKALFAKQQAQAAAIAAERDLIAREHQEFLASELDKYRSTFQALVEDNRILSGVFPGKMSCKIRIKLLPDGSIANIAVIESSGNQAYDDMSKTAIYKSAPFPMPEDQELYGQLRDIILSFKNEEDTLDVS